MVRRGVRPNTKQFFFPNNFFFQGGVGWYGGGADLTPYYLFDQDAKEFHEFYKVAFFFFSFFLPICMCMCMCICVSFEYIEYL